MTRQKTVRLLVAASAILLLGTSLLHAFAGYPVLSRALASTNLKPPVVAVLQIFWVALSVHWVIAGAVALLAGFQRQGRGGAALLLLLAALLPGFDGVAGLVRVGLFPGNFLLILASTLLVASSIVRRLANGD
jgi:hypothetical protein